MSTGYGNMRPDQTYALGGPGETYYNPESGNAERMPASEILFEQWRIASQRQQQKRPELCVKEETMAGDSLPMLKVIRAAIGKPAVRAFPGQESFFALLAIPNATAAIFLIRDHADELGIRTITKIELQSNSRMLINFG